MVWLPINGMFCKTCVHGRWHPQVLGIRTQRYLYGEHSSTHKKGFSYSKAVAPTMGPGQCLLMCWWHPIDSGCVGIMGNWGCIPVPGQVSQLCCSWGSMECPLSICQVAAWEIHVLIIKYSREDPSPEPLAPRLSLWLLQLSPDSLTNRHWWGAGVHSGKAGSWNAASWLGWADGGVVIKGAC